MFQTENCLPTHTYNFYITDLSFISLFLYITLVNRLLLFLSIFVFNILIYHDGKHLNKRADIIKGFSIKMYLFEL